MNVNVVAFARVREQIGIDRFQLSMDEGSTLGDLKSELQHRYPEIAAILSYCSISIDHEYSQDEAPLTDGCEVGLIPPVSGG